MDQDVMTSQVKPQQGTQGWSVLPVPGVVAPPIPGNLVSPVTYRYLHHSFDRKSQSSSSQRMDTRVGTIHGSPNAKHFRQSRTEVLTPLAAQSSITTTTTTTSTVTTTTTTNSGNQFTNFQPWYSTVTRTDVHQSTHTQRDSDMLSLTPPSAMDVTTPVVEVEQSFSTEPATDTRIGRRRRSASERTDSEKRNQQFCACRPHHGTSRRVRGISTPASMAPIEIKQEELQVQLTKLENFGVAHPWTPEASIRLNFPPKASDLLIVRLLLDETEANDDSLHFVTAIAPKFSLNDQGIVQIPSQPIPPSVLALGITLDQCRLSFSLLSGERVFATYVSDYLGGSSAEIAPSSKRPRFH